MIISKFKRELNGDVSEIRLNTGEKLQNVEYLTDLEEKTVTENGTYTPSTGKVGFSKVVVNVSGGSATKLYAWIEALNSECIYTTSATPSVGDDVIGIFQEYSTWLEKKSVGSVGDSGITVGEGETVYARSSANDITL